MKRIMIVGGVVETPDGQAFFHNYLAGVQKALGEEYEVLFTRADALQFVLGDDGITVYDTTHNQPLSTFDLIMLHGFIRKYRDVAYTLSRFCAMRGIPYFNDFSSYYPGTKIGQAVVFVEQGARIPKTLFAMDNTQLLALIEKELALPFVLKDASGTKGESNYLVHTLDEARQRLAEEPHLTFIAQEFCPNDCDYRLLLAPGQQLVFARRGGAGTHLNNTSKGGVAEPAPDAVPAEVIATSRRVSEALGLRLSGMDVMQHLETGEFYFIEVNSQPQLFTGALLEEKSAFARKLFLDAFGDTTTR